MLAEMPIQSILKGNFFPFFFEVAFYTLPHLKCVRLVSVRLSLPCINKGVRIELTYGLR